MSAISDFSTAVTQHLDKIDNGLEAIAGDVSELKTEIEALKNSDTISAEDKVALTGILARVGKIEDRVTAIDDLTPPTPPA